jgi:glycosyltransferase involved in cell wall biosynthesis
MTMATRPKVLSLIDTYYIGGAGKVILQFFEHADARVACTLGTFRHANPPSTEFIDAARKKGFDIALFDQRFNLDPTPLWQVYRLLKQQGFNIIETHGYKGHLIAWLLRRLLPIKWVGVTHGWTNENAKIRLYNRLEQKLLESADHVISVSPQLAETMREIRGDKNGVSLVLNAVDEAAIPGKGAGEANAIRQQCLGDAADTGILLGSFGRLSPEKGHRVLLEAMARIDTTLPLALLVVGEGQERPALELMAEQLGIGERVFFAGQRANMRDYYEAIDLYVLPSLSEGLPFVVLEAMALEKPVLATRVGAIAEVIEEGSNGWMIPPGESDTMAAALNSLLKDRSKLKEAGQRAREMLYPKFSPQRQASEVIGIYQEVLDGHE